MDWHLGSGSVVYGQFEAHVRDLAINDYYQRLYEYYCAGRYHTAYSTVLLLLERRSA